MKPYQTVFTVGVTALLVAAGFWMVHHKPTYPLCTLKCYSADEAYVDASGHSPCGCDEGRCWLGSYQAIGNCVIERGKHALP